MRRLLVAVLGAFMFVAVGCQSDGGGDKMSGRSSGDAMKASADACPHCPGVQKMTADGKCPMCGKMMSDASMKGSGSMSSGSGAMKASADACAMCPGVQTASADGMCPACGMEVAKKQQ